MTENFTLPILPLRNAVLFPGVSFPISAGRSGTLRAIDEAMKHPDRLVFAVAQRQDLEKVTPEGLYTVGTVASIVQLERGLGGARLFLQGQKRGIAVRFVERGRNAGSGRRRCGRDAASRPGSAGLRRPRKRKCANAPPSWADGWAFPTRPRTGSWKRCPNRAALPTSWPAISTFRPPSASTSRDSLRRGAASPRSRPRSEADRRPLSPGGPQVESSGRDRRPSARDAPARADEGDPEGAGRGRGKGRRGPQGAESRSWTDFLCPRRLDAKSSANGPGSPGSGASRWSPRSSGPTSRRSAELPWGARSEDHLDVREAARVLDEDHYALSGREGPHPRVPRGRPAARLRPTSGGDAGAPQAGAKPGKGKILLFAGPPGTGKTSIAKSIARAMGRKYVRISLGGARDEADIRGHRRTYVGALPGRILQGMRQAGTKNPVFLLDEIDKLGVSFQGDPAAALLEVLDPAQNDSFTDHYLGVPFDLSEVLFIATANFIQNIPAPLLDRLETVEFSGYTEAEKLEIARLYLLPRQLAENGLKPGQIRARRRGDLGRRLELHAGSRGPPARARAGTARAEDRPEDRRRRDRERPRSAPTAFRLSSAGRRSTPRRPTARTGSESPRGCTTPRPAATSCSSRRRSCAGRGT